MAAKKNQAVISSRRPNLVSHRAHCTICAHPQREEIELQYISWKSPEKIATEHKLRDRSAVYRHARALGLESRRARNIRAALGRMIEKVDEAPASAGAIVQAIALYARINGRGELIERDEQVGIHDQFAKMNPDECDAYAKNGTLPGWFHQSQDTTGPTGSGGDENA